MTKYRIKLYSKEKKSLTKFLNVIKQSQNFQLILNVKRKKRKKDKITILKSPHINKKAQEQFQFITHMSILTYFTWDQKKGTIFLKKIKNNLFPGIYIKVDYAQSVSNKKFTAKTNLFYPLKLARYKTILSDIKLQKNRRLFYKNQIIKETYKKKVLTTLKRISNYGK